MKKSLLALLLFVGVFFLAACAVEPEDITLNATQVSLEVGETFTLTAEVSPEDAEYDAIEYSSANTSIVTVNSSGLLTAVGAGTTSVTVAVGDELSGFVQVTVTAPVVEDDDDDDDDEPVVEPDPVAVQVTSEATDITVPYGTAVADVIALLPATAIVEDEDGATYEVALRWVVLNYSPTASPDAPVEYIASATFPLPEGVRLGSLVTKIDVMVTRQSTLAQLALDLINEDPASATAADFVTAGVEGVTELNLSQITPTLVAANEDKEEAWLLADVQGVVDSLLPGLLGTIYDVPAPELVWDMTLEMDGSELVSVEVRSGDLYAQFLADEINPLLLAFLENHADELNNQRVSFEFTLDSATTDKELIRMTYLELARDLAGDMITIPNSLLFNGLIIDGMGFEIEDLELGANNIVVRNLDVDQDLVLDGIARDVLIADSNIDDLEVKIDATVTVNNVAFRVIDPDIGDGDSTLTLVGQVSVLGSTLDIQGNVNGLNVVAGATGETVTIEGHLKDFEIGADLDLDLDSSSTLENGSFLGDVSNDMYTLTLIGEIQANGGTIDVEFLLLDEAQLFDADITSDVEIVAESEGNEIHNSTVVALSVEDDAELVMAAPVFTNNVTVKSGSALTLAGGTFDGGITVDARTGSAVVLAAPVSITNGALTLDGAGEISGLANLPIAIDGLLIVGQAWALNVEGTALDFTWQSATPAGVYATAKTGAAYTALLADLGNTLRLVVSNAASEDVVTLAAIGPVDANLLYVTNSAVSVSEEITASASVNTTFSAVLKTENGYDLLENGLYDILVSSSALTTTKTGTAILEGSVLELALSITAAGLYEDVEVYVRPYAFTPSAFTLIGSVDFEVATATPTTITAVENDLPAAGEVGKGTTANWTLLVTDVFGNPIEGFVPSATITGTGLESGTEFEAIAATNVSGQTMLVLNVDADQVRNFVISVTGAGIENGIINLLISPVSTVNAGNSSASMAASVTAGAQLVVELELKDAEGSGLVINGNGYEVRLVDEDGDVLATTSAVFASGATTGTATFTLVTAGAYTVDVHVESLDDSGSFIPVETEVDLAVVVAAADEIVLSDDVEDPTLLGQGKSETITFTVEDAFGNPIPGVVVTYSGVQSNAVTGTGFGANGLTTMGSITTDANGQGSVVVTVAQNQPVSTDVIELDLEIAADTVSLDVNAIEEVTAANSDAELGATTGSAVANNNLSVVVEVGNASGAAFANGTYDVMIELVDGTTMSAVVTLANGTGTALFTLTGAGVYEDIKVFVEDVEIATLEDFTVIAGPTAAGTESFDAADELGAEGDADGSVARGRAYEVTFTATDAEGNPLAGVTASAVLELLSGLRSENTGLALTETGDTSLELELTTNAQGEATFYVVLDLEEVYSLEGQTTDNKYELTLLSQSGTSEVYEFEVNPSTEILNLISNGDFSENELGDFVIFTENAGQMTGSVTGGALTLELTGLGDLAHQPHLYQMIGDLIPGDYVFVIKITSSVDRDIRVNVVKPDEGFVSILPNNAFNASLDSEQEEEVTLEFEVNSTQLNVKFEINFGDLGEEFVSEVGTFEITEVLFYRK